MTDQLLSVNKPNQRERRASERRGSVSPKKGGASGIKEKLQERVIDKVTLMEQLEEEKRMLDMLPLEQRWNSGAYSAAD